MADSELTLDQKLLSAIVALLVEQRERAADTPDAVKSEVLLAGAGLTAGEIATLLGKQPAAVRMALSRARRGSKGE